MSDSNLGGAAIVIHSMSNPYGNLRLVFQSMGLVVLSLATGCASIVSKSDYPVSLSSEPSGAEVTVLNEKGNEFFRGQTPTQVVLPSSSGYFDSADYSVQFQLPGHADRTALLRSSLDGWYFGNLLFGGLLGFLIVDPATGAMYGLPKSVSASLQEIDSATPPPSGEVLLQVRQQWKQSGTDAGGRNSGMPLKKALDLIGSGPSAKIGVGSTKGWQWIGEDGSLLTLRVRAGKVLGCSHSKAREPVSESDKK